MKSPDRQTSERQEAPPGELRFSVDAALLFQLGEELVNKRSVALAELIKNAYDADATTVTITFRSIQSVGGQILLSDDGTGMPLARIQAAWMRIATTAKADKPYSERFGRPQTGAKGLGRFAARRLAGELILTSVAHIDPDLPATGREETVVELKWDRFAAGAELEDVPVAFRHRNLPSSPDGRGTGTTLLLRGARDAWTADDLAALQRDLQKLMSPRASTSSHKGAERDPGFVVRIEAAEFPAFEGELQDTFLANALGVLEGTVNKQGKPQYSLTFRGRKTIAFTPPVARFPLVGSAAFTVHFFVYKKDFLGGLAIKPREAQRKGRDEGGVHVYMDRFRVPPYGDPGDDWLHLDEDRGRRITDVPEELLKVARKLPRPMLFLPGNNQLFGRVDISRVSNPLLNQTLNRERLIENEAFRELRRVVRLGIDWMTVCYAREFASSRQAKKRSQNDPLNLLARARKQFQAAAQDMPSEQRSQILQAIDLATRTVEEQQEELIGELAMLRILASTGTMIVVFEHQLAGTLQGLRRAHTTLQQLADQLATGAKERVTAELVRLNRWIDTAEHQGELLGLLIARESRSRRQRIAIRPVVEAVKQAFDSYARDYAIDLANEVPETLRTPPMFEAELTAVLINLITNAFKAVRDQPTRRVVVRGAVMDKAVAIRVEDTGVGLARADWEEYFKPFVGDSEPDPLLGEGTGLGLKIVRDFVDIYGGQARFVPPTPDWRTSIEVTFPDESD